MSALAIGGGIASGIGSLLAANTQNNAYNNASQQQRTNASYAENTLGQNLYGPAYTAFQAKLYKAIFDAQDGKPGAAQAFQDLANSPEYAAYAKASGGPVIPQLQSIANNYIQQGNQQLGTYANQTNALDQQGKGLSGQIANWGAGQAKLINTQADQALRSTNDQSLARLNATGLGASTAAPMTLASNTRQNELTRQQSLQNLSNQQLTAQNQQGNTNLSQLANRYQGQTSLWGSLQDRNLNLSLMPVQAQQQGTNSIANIWSGMPVGQSPGLSGSGSALSNIGNAVSQYGSLQALAGIYGAGKQPAANGTVGAGLPGGSYGYTNAGPGN